MKYYRRFSDSDGISWSVWDSLSIEERSELLSRLNDRYAKVDRKELIYANVIDEE